MNNETEFVTITKKFEVGKDLQFTTYFVVKSYDMNKKGTLHSKMREGVEYLKKDDLGRGLYKATIDSIERYLSETDFMDMLHTGWPMEEVQFGPIEMHFKTVRIYDINVILENNMIDFKKIRTGFSREMVEAQLDIINKELPSKAIQLKKIKKGYLVELGLNFLKLNDQNQLVLID